ncbi:MAG TPA: hypothetical protein PK208_07145, partial [Fibrobacteria bacterium]|nr:hypothetical protein [Fibrobacteria bacterium]
MSTRATNPTNSGSMLLDRSTAKPGSIDKAVFEKKTGAAAGSSVGQGTVNPDYLKECREDNPEPAAGAGGGAAGAAPAAKVTLTDTDAFVATYAPVIRDPAMQAYLTDQVSGAIVQQLKVEQLVGDLVDHRLVVHRR